MPKDFSLAFSELMPSFRCYKMITIVTSTPLPRNTIIFCCNERKRKTNNILDYFLNVNVTTVAEPLDTNN